MTSPPSIGVYNGSLYVVASNAGIVYQIWLIGSSWTSWIPITTGGDPIIQVYGSEYHVLSRLGDGSVLNSWYAGYWAFQNLGFRISSRPVVAVYNGEFHVVGSYGNTVYQLFYNGGGWSGLQQVGTGRDPAVVVFGREFHVVGRRVELVFDPFDLTFMRVRQDGCDAGTATPFQLTRHSHPKARPEVPAEEPKPTTGIDYLGLIDAQYTAELAERVNYAAFADAPSDQQPPLDADGLDLGPESPY